VTAPDGPPPDLTLALELADLADEMALARYGAPDLAVETKADRTPVTDVDKAIEELLRRRIGSSRPGQAIVGEEGGDGGCGAGASTRWVLDPIDGTKNYVRGVPVWGTLIGLERDGQGVLGVVSAPALARRWFATAGGGAWSGTSWWARHRLRVSSVGDLSRASLSYDSVVGFDQHGLLPGFLSLAHRCARTRAFGDFWSHMLVAEGAIDVAVEPEVAHWDVAAVSVIVTEAGGRFSDLSGATRTDGGSAVSTNGVLHDAVLATLAPVAPTRSARPVAAATSDG